MIKGNEWKRFFDGHAPDYMKNSFTKNTIKEVDFIIEMLKLSPDSAILDIGCGTGRHAVELAKRNYRVTGVDISSGMLAQAKKAAKGANVNIEWIEADASLFSPEKSFDAAICLCEGAFGLLASNDDPIDHDLAILTNIHKALKPGAPLMLTGLNGLAKIRKFSQQDVKNGLFDPLNMTETFTMSWDSPDGQKSIKGRERGYVPTELILLCRLAGYDVEHIWGGTAGNWGQRTVDLDEIEIMIIAEKSFIKVAP